MLMLNEGIGNFCFLESKASILLFLSRLKLKKGASFATNKGGI